MDNNTSDETGSHSGFEYSNWKRPELHKIRNWFRWFKETTRVLPKPEWIEPSSKFIAAAPFPNGGALVLKREVNNGEQWLLRYHRTMHGNGLTRVDMIQFLELCQEELRDMTELLTELPIGIPFDTLVEKS